MEELSRNPPLTAPRPQPCVDVALLRDLFASEVAMRGKGTATLPPDAAANAAATLAAWKRYNILDYGRLIELGLGGSDGL
mgnify:CR=1 FL=1